MNIEELERAFAEAAVGLVQAQAKVASLHRQLNAAKEEEHRAERRISNARRELRAAMGEPESNQR